MSYAEHISDEELKQMPTGAFDGEIIVVEREADINAACDYLLAQPVIGFDTETRPSFVAGRMNSVALLQLSSATRCYLFRLCRMRLDKAILKVMESKRTLKIGADIKGDLNAMLKLRKFRPAGMVDLQSMVEQYGIKEKSVRKMSAIVLGCKISKAQRLSNWEASALTPAQQLYAATDAWACYTIYRKLTGGR